MIARVGSRVELIKSDKSCIHTKHKDTEQQDWNVSETRMFIWKELIKDPIMLTKLVNMVVPL